MSGLDTLLIIVVIVLIIILLGAYAWYKIKSKLLLFTRTLWGTDSIQKGIKKMQAEYSSTPKSVSAMTSLYLPKIVRDFPEFQYDEMKGRAQNVLTSYLQAIDRQEPALLSEGGEELRDKLALRIDSLKAAGRREHFEKIHIHRTEISGYRKDSGRCIVTFQSSIQYYHYTNGRDGGIAEGRNDMYEQARYNVDLVYIQDREKAGNQGDAGKGLNCPNCGAPLSGLGAKLCEYCGTPVVELNIHVWNFNEVKEIR